MIKNARAGMKVRFIDADPYARVPAGATGTIVKRSVPGARTPSTTFGPYVYVDMDGRTGIDRYQHTHRANLEPVARPKESAESLPAELITEIQNASIADLAILIRGDWSRVYSGAVPYLDAMSALESINENFGLDSGRSIVVYFLANAHSWRGPVAKAVKAELSVRLKGGQR